jgi:hypothetical protein
MLMSLIQEIGELDDSHLLQPVHLVQLDLVALPQATFFPRSRKSFRQQYFIIRRQQ